MAMARTTVPIAEKNPFLTSKHLAPSSSLSRRLGTSPGSHYDTDEDEEGLDAQEGSECSETSVESEYAIDETVKEEMTKLEDTLREIGMRFRMIARIGEGIARTLVSSVYESHYPLTGLSRNFLDRLQGRRLALRVLSERLGHRTKGCLEVDISSFQEETERVNVEPWSRSTPPA